MLKRVVSFVFLMFLSWSPNVRAMIDESIENKLLLKKNEYMLEVGDKGLERLKLQHKLIKHHTRTHLEMAKISKDHIVYDVGCGPGVVTEELALRAKYVYAVDSSEDQLLLAKERIKKAGLDNVTFILGDIRLIEQFPHEGEVDLVYTSLVLAHVNDPENVINVQKKDAIMIV